MAKFDVSIVQNYFIEAAGIRHIDWHRFFEYLSKNNLNLAAGGHEWDQILKTWLRAAANDLGQNYQVFESENFCFLSGESASSSERILRFAEAALARIQEVLSDFQSGEKWKIVLILFENGDDYLNYLEIYRGGTTFSTSAGGIFLNHAGYQHIVLGPNEVPLVEQAVAHELTHYMLAPYEVPLWLDEGLAVTIERYLFGRDLLVSDEDYQRHQQLWTDENIEKFLDGQAFSDFDPILTYGLAEILVRGLFDSNREAFVSFIKNATQADGGVAALQEHLGLDVRDLIRRFIRQTA